MWTWICIWLLAVVEGVLVTSELKTGWRPTAECVVQADGQIVWREEAKMGNVELTTANGFCHTGALCPGYPDNTTTQSTAEMLQFSLQAGDSLGIRIISGDVVGFGVESKNVTTVQVAVVNTPQFECSNSFIKPEDIIWEESYNTNQTVNIQSALLPNGDNRFLVFVQEFDCRSVWAIQVTVRLQECGLSDGFDTCSNHGACLLDSSKDSYSCQCCSGYVGRYCEERDGCHANPCQNGGFCVDIAEGLYGSTYQCLCAHGYTGQTCEEKVNVCDKRPCHNNGTCYGNDTNYWCECPAGFTGHECATNVNDCLPNPCVHGVCEDGVGKYKCYCLSGYGGDHCEFEYDECDSSPCINGGACEDLVAGYKCHCGPGYTGWRCQTKVNLCEPNPCPTPAQCVDRGNNYSCICHPGYNGPGCTQHYDPCYPNPCQNGGSCWPSLDSFFCSCRPGYTGDMCEELVYPPRPLAHTLEDTAVHADGATVGPAQPDHLHNVYIAAATLGGACFIVVLVVTICHCRVNKTYLKFTRQLSRSCSDLKQQKLEDPNKFSLNLHGSASERRLFADSVYEATCVDIADNLSVPLIE